MANIVHFFKTEQKQVLVLDFGYSAVRGLVLERNGARGENVIQKYHCQKIERFGVFNKKGISQHQDFELEIIKKAIQKLVANLGVGGRFWKLKPIIGFSPETLKARIVQVAFQRKQAAEKITKQELEKILQNVFKQAKKKVFAQRGAKQIVFQDLQIIKQKILEKKLSGYKIDSLLGLKGQNLEFKLLVVFMLRDDFKFMQKLLNFLKLKNSQISHIAEGLVKYKKTKTKISQMFLDIGENSTQVFCFNRGLQFIDEFSVGRSNFSRTLQKGLGVKQNEAEILQQKFAQGKLTPVVQNKLKSMLVPVLSVWLNALQKKLSAKGQSSNTFAKQIFLFGQGASLPGIKQSFPGSLVRVLTMDDLSIKNKIGKQLSAEAIPSILLASATNS